MKDWLIGFTIVYAGVIMGALTVLALFGIISIATVFLEQTRVHNKISY